MVFPAIGGILGVALVVLIGIALLDPDRFRQAGLALTPFASGFGALVQAPLEPIGKLGVEIGEFGRGLGEFGKGFESFAGGIGTGISGITAPFMSFLDWAAWLTGTKPKGDWADTQQTQFLEEILLKSGWNRG